MTINGIAKGAGMIAPDMATMLSFIFTDAPIAAPVLQALLKKGADKSFNCVTVDSDTSTSDTLLFFATGAAAQGRARDRAAERPPPEGIPQRARGPARATSPSRSRATARARASSSP